MQETTIIAELSGLRSHELFRDGLGDDGLDDRVQLVYSEAKAHPMPRRSSASRKTRKKSSSSERDTSGNKSRRQKKHESKPGFV